MIAFAVVAGVFLVVAAVLAVVRMERGPSMLDRSVAFDVLATCLIGAVVVEAWWARRLEAMPVVVVLAMVGFSGSVSIARFASREPGESAEAGGMGEPGESGEAGGIDVDAETRDDNAAESIVAPREETEN
ncbi:MAG: MrpF/PhaF family protein [Cellulomonadaceae bacterium]|jgi:multicomponent Na+:H+ antiporter subunit F|nr:MrpF/PhaF family protein [Cellulomonadaceae bacterium]